MPILYEYLWSSTESVNYIKSMYFFYLQNNVLSSLVKRSDVDVHISQVYADLLKVKATFDLFRREADTRHKLCAFYLDSGYILNKVVWLNPIYFEKKDTSRNL